jgi:aflatoxin B1 aldehyde reductase
MTSQLINTVLGAGLFGTHPGSPASGLNGNIQPLLDAFKKYGYNHIDTARVYGTSETVLGDQNVEGQGFIIDTKISSFFPGAHKAENVKKSFQESLVELKTKKVHILYLHGPDRSVPFEEPLKAINEIYQSGGFEKFGISNYGADEVDEIYNIAKKNNYVLPTVYQGSYNAVDRAGEGVLFPVLRKHNIAFYAYSPLAGGFFNQKREVALKEGGRFDATTGVGQLYAGKYIKPSYFSALEKLEKVSQGLSNSEIAIRWLYHHSQLAAKYGDAAIIGASRASQIENTLDWVKKGPLPTEIVQTFDSIWKDIEKDAPSYYFPPGLKIE